MNSNPFKTVLKLFVLITGVIALPFCVEATVPAGLWVSPCQQGLLKIQSLLSPFQSKTTEQFHQDQACKQISFEFITSGDLSYPEKENTIDFTYSEIQLIIHVEDVIKDFNQRAVCGFTDWKKSEARTITGLSCALFNMSKPTQIPFAGVIKYGIYKIENERLYFGLMTKENDGSSAERRPLSYDGRFYQLSNAQDCPDICYNLSLNNSRTPPMANGSYLINFEIR